MTGGLSTPRVGRLAGQMSDAPLTVTLTVRDLDRRAGTQLRYGGGTIVLAERVPGTRTEWLARRWDGATVTVLCVPEADVVTGPLSTTTLTLPEGAWLVPPDRCSGCGCHDPRGVHALPECGCPGAPHPREVATLFKSALYRVMIELYPAGPDGIWPDPDEVTAARIRAAVLRWADLNVPAPSGGAS